MTEPTSLAAVDVPALTEGVKFLYARAGDLLKWWRDRDRRSDTQSQLRVELPQEVFVGNLHPIQPDSRGLSALLVPLRELRASLAEYAQGIDPIDPADTALLAKIDALRSAVEAVYGQRLTFIGEAAPPSGTPVQGSARADEAFGYLAAVRPRPSPEVQGSSPSQPRDADGPKTTLGTSGIAQVDDQFDLDVRLSAPTGTPRDRPLVGGVQLADDVTTECFTAGCSTLETCDQHLEDCGFPFTFALDSHSPCEDQTDDTCGGCGGGGGEDGPGEDDPDPPTGVNC